ncbi:uncharacterized protein EV154DRAFT_530868 [Mucor mucedo]|uniref:uncharacterized protein n=1 Tax=Mucor mucedo TaxID=29922 RepID=UPI00221E509B|nr:uncharacterized protein EV154DRAFT_530868 [Mucor mucedo]KAI7869253.1 hypothetical protein EV154DRAFT_530868 [Mucor mucedo]
MTRFFFLNCRDEVYKIDLWGLWGGGDVVTSIMPNWNQLPLELLVKIFEFAVKGNEKLWERLKQYLIISKPWSLASRRVVYEKVYLHESNFEGFIEYMLRSPNGQLVKQLKWKNSEKADELEYKLSRILKACPNLIDLGYNTTQRSPFYAKLLSEHYTSKNGLKLIKIPVSSDIYKVEESEDSLRAYGYAVLAFNKTLQCLRINDYPPVEDKYDLDETANSLGGFEKLQSIEFHFEVHDNLFKIAAKIQNCPTIKYLKIYTSELGYNLQESNMVVEPFNTQPIPNIIGLSIGNYMNICTNFLNYVMYSFPSLKTLHVNERDVGAVGPGGIYMTATLILETLGYQVTTELWIQFFTYINTLESCAVSNMFIQDHREVFANFPNLCDHLEINFRTELLQGVIKPYIGVFNNCSADYNLTAKNADPKKTRRTVLTLHPSMEGVDSHLESTIDIFGSTLKALHIDIGSIADTQRSANMLYYASERCPVLNTLWISSGWFYGFDPESFTPMQSLKCIQFRNCYFQGDFLYELSSRLSTVVEFFLFIDCDLANFSKGTFVMIDMPFVTFGHLLWKDGHAGATKPVFIKITKTQAKTFYYKIDINLEITISSSENFDSSRYNDEVLSLHIRCFDIDILILVADETGFAFDMTHPFQLFDEYEYMDRYPEFQYLIAYAESD